MLQEKNGVQQKKSSSNLFWLYAFKVKLLHLCLTYWLHFNKTHAMHYWVKGIKVWIWLRGHIITYWFSPQSTFWDANFPIGQDCIHMCRFLFKIPILHSILRQWKICWMICELMKIRKNTTLHQNGGSWERWNVKKTKMQEYYIHKKPMYEKMV
jgi:hypothetical protein